MAESKIFTNINWFVKNNTQYPSGNMAGITTLAQLGLSIFRGGRYPDEIKNYNGRHDDAISPVLVYDNIPRLMEIWNRLILQGYICSRRRLPGTLEASSQLMAIEQDYQYNEFFRWGGRPTTLNKFDTDNNVIRAFNFLSSVIDSKKRYKEQKATWDLDTDPEKEPFKFDNNYADYCLAITNVEAINRYPDIWASDLNNIILDMINWFKEYIDPTKFLEVYGVSIDTLNLAGTTNSLTNFNDWDELYYIYQGGSNWSQPAEKILGAVKTKVYPDTGLEERIRSSAYIKRSIEGSDGRDVDGSIPWNLESIIVEDQVENNYDPENIHNTKTYYGVTRCTYPNPVTFDALYYKSDLGKLCVMFYTGLNSYENELFMSENPPSGSSDNLGLMSGYFFDIGTYGDTKLPEPVINDIILNTEQTTQELQDNDNYITFMDNIALYLRLD